MKNKNLSVWLTLLAGPVGAHRFYLRGWRDRLGWALMVPSALGGYGVIRAQQFGIDDQTSWVLMPLLGFTFAGCALTAIIYALMPKEKWNGAFNRDSDPHADAGETNWLTVVALVTSMFLGTTALLSSLAFGMQRYFEYQVQGVQGAATVAQVSKKV